MPSKISVVVTTFNHEKYIGQCLQSILDQTGDFDLEIIVGDDCSMDGTRLIAQEFKDKNPQRISLLPSPKNLGVTKNLKRCLDACSGEYIAVCEGDDYWTHPRKLQIQQDFLKQHAECSMCFCALTLYYQDKQEWTPHAGQASLKKAYLSTADLIRVNYIGTFSCCMYRADVVRRLPPALFEMYTVDWMFNMACGELGKIGYIRDRMCVYRLHSQGAWTGQGEQQRLDALSRSIDDYNAFFQYKYDRLFGELKARTQAARNASLAADAHGLEDRAALARGPFVGKLRAGKQLMARLARKFAQLGRRL
jgi:glycosyltransferase involved in cell wall biosynthesis